MFYALKIILNIIQFFFDSRRNRKKKLTLKKQKNRTLTIFVSNVEIVIYEISTRRHFSRMSALFEARATKRRVLHLGECAVFSHRNLYNIF
jgi:hypothetical protein